MKKDSQTGFAHLGLLLLVLVVLVVAGVGYKVAKNHKSMPVSNATTSVTNPAQVQTIKTPADLDKVESTLNNTDVDSDLNPDALNQDVNSLL